MTSKQTDSKKRLRCKAEQKEKKPAENNGLESYLKLSAPEKDYLKKIGWAVLTHLKMTSKDLLK